MPSSIREVIHLDKRKSFKTAFSWNQSGITLIEILLVLVLALLVFAPAYNAFQVANKTWTHTEASNPKYTETDTVLTYLAQDIRQASRPSDNNNVKAVTIQDNNKGQILTMYKYNTTTNEWEKIFYKVEDDTLSRALIPKADPADILTVSQPGSNSSDWKVILTGLTDTSVFKENGRAVEINLQIGDTSNNPRFQPIAVNSSFLIRSREVGTIHDNPGQDPGSGNPPNGDNIQVKSITISPPSISHTTNQEKVYDLEAILEPKNATNKNVTWSSSDSSKVSINNNNSLKIKITVKGRIQNNSSITITATCENKSATCTIRR